MSSFEHFYLVEQHSRGWRIHHQITDELAGTILRTPRGFRLLDENGRIVGTFASVENAIQGLYAIA